MECEEKVSHSPQEAVSIEKSSESQPQHDSERWCFIVSSSLQQAFTQDILSFFLFSLMTSLDV